MNAALHFSDIRRLLPELELPATNGENRSLSDCHSRALERKGIAPENFTDESADQLLTLLAQRQEDGLCTLRQAAALEKFGVPNPASAPFDEVERRIAQARITYWHNYVETLSWVKGSLNSTEYEAFLRAASLNVDKATAIEVVSEKIRVAGDCPKRTKLDAEFNSAFRYATNHVYEGPEAGAPRKDPEPDYEPDYLKSFASGLHDEIDSKYLEIRSEFICWNRSPAGFLHKVFRPGEHVWVTDNTVSRDGLIWTHEGLVQDLAELNHLMTGRLGVWFLSNPIDGAPHQLERLASEHNTEGISFRATENITDWRHVVLETDVAPEALWLKALCLLRLPIVAIYHSGGRGPHALVNLGASTFHQWQERLAPHRDHLIRLGACPGTLTSVRLSRLPNCLRGQTGRWQQLLYLAPNADFTPIAKRPARESRLAVWERCKLAVAHYGPSDNDYPPSLLDL